MISFLIVVLLAAFPVMASETSFSITGSQTEVMLDASNYRIYNCDFTETIMFDNMQPGTFSEDTIISNIQNDSTGNRIRVWGKLGSETGEPLFIRFQQGATNKEHMVYAGSEMHFFSDHLQLRGGYHHLGSYSDRTDSILAQLTQRYGYEPKYFSTGRYGISEYYFGVWKLVLPNVNARGIVRKYGNWVMMPVNYDPVYISGYRYSQDVSLERGADTLRVNADFDLQSRYFNHIDATEENILTGTAAWNHRFTEQILAGVFMSGNTDVDARCLLKANLRFDRNEKIAYWFETGMWSDFEPMGEGGISWSADSNITLLSKLQYAYTPGQKSYSYLDCIDTVNLDVESFRETKLITSVTCQAVYALPVSCKGWLLLQAGAPEYTVVSDSNNRSVSVCQSNDVIMSAGGKIAADFELKKVSLLINPWIQGNYFFTGELPEIIPCEAGCEIAWLTGYNKLNRYALSLTWRAPYSITIKTNGHSAKLQSEHLLFMNLSISIPFVSPIFNDHLKPSIEIQAGPIHLLHDTREAFHPFGNQFGPAISAKMTIDLL